MPLWRRVAAIGWYRLSLWAVALNRMAGVTEKVLPHLETMPPDSILHRVDQLEKLDRIARRNYGLDSNQEHSGITLFPREAWRN
jgi:hypothetical protein